MFLSLDIPSKSFHGFDRSWGIEIFLDVTLCIKLNALFEQLVSACQNDGWVFYYNKAWDCVVGKPRYQDLYIPLKTKYL